MHNSFIELPEDVHIKIVNNLLGHMDGYSPLFLIKPDVKAFCSLSQTCRKLNKLCNDIFNKNKPPEKHDINNEDLQIINHAEYLKLRCSKYWVMKYYFSYINSNHNYVFSESKDYTSLGFPRTGYVHIKPRYINEISDFRIVYLENVGFEKEEFDLFVDKGTIMIMKECQFRDLINPYYLKFIETNVKPIKGQDFATHPTMFNLLKITSLR